MVHMRGFSCSRFFAFLLPAFLLLVPIATAGSFDILRVDHIRTPDYPVQGYFPLRVEVANEGARAAEDVHVRSWMPTFSDRAYGEINEVTGFNKGRWLLQDIPSSTSKGEYWIRITVSNDDERRVKHRLVFLDDQSLRNTASPETAGEPVYVNYRTNDGGARVVSSTSYATYSSRDY